MCRPSSLFLLLFQVLLHGGDERVELVADIEHPLGQEFAGVVDEGLGNLAVEGVGDRTSDSRESVGITAQGDGEFQAIDVIFALKEADECGRHGELTGLVEVEIWLNQIVGTL